MLDLIDLTKSYRIKEKGILRPKYRLVTALNGVSLSISNTNTLAILGPNGSGKSTLCKIAAGMIKPTSGEALLNGIDLTENVRRLSKEIGVVLGPALVYHRQTGYKYLRFFAKIYGVTQYDKRINELSKMMNLEKWLNTHIESYSLGMKIKISLARCLLHDPHFLVLDEFTMGLDPLAAKEIRRFIKGMRKTTLLTTHNTLEAEMMSHKVALISGGNLIVSDTLGNLFKPLKKKLKLVVALKDVSEAKKALAGDHAISFLENTKGDLEIVARDQEISGILKILSQHKVTSMYTTAPTLEDAYAHFTGELLDEKAKVV